MTARSLQIACAAAAALLTASTVTWIPTPTNVLIVTLDTTRADRLGAYGYGRAATPTIDRLAREGTVFERALSVAPLTLTAHTSLFTGLYPPRHGVRGNTDRPLDAGVPVLAEILHRHGFRTAAFVGATVLGKDRGLARGFDVYDDGGREPKAAPRRRQGRDVVDGALAWLASPPAVPSPFFVWLHLYDVHAPQLLPEPYRSAYAGEMYDGGVALVDAQLARLVDMVDRRAGERTLIIVVGDHGESLGEHGEIEHGIFVYEADVHVPLIVRGPGVRRGVVPAPVSLVDVMPTVLGFLSISSPAADGLSLAGTLRHGTPVPNRLVYSESLYPRWFGWSPLRAVRDGRFKFIDAPRPELYDLAADPLEAHDLSGVRPALASALRDRVRRFDPAAGAPKLTTLPAVPDDVRERLAALGYTSDARRAAAAPPDPKDVIQLFNARRHAER